MSDRKEKTKRRQEETLSRICQATINILQKKKFQAASMREIAKASDISLGNLYNYIEKKEDILILLYKDMDSRIRHCIDDTLHHYEHPVDQLVQIMQRLFYLACSMKDVALIVLTEAKSLFKEDLYDLLQKESKTITTIEGILEQGVSQGLFHCKKPNLLANVIIYNMWLVPLRGWNILLKHNEREACDQVIGLILKELAVSERAVSINSMNLDGAAKKFKQSDKRKEKVK